MTTRRLAAIVAADVAGYSRLMHADEEGTHARFNQVMVGAVKPAVAQNRGRIVKTTGDGFLAEFQSAVAAVRSAIQFQAGVSQLLAGDAPEKRLSFRVGIHLGEVIVEERDIYGDGVNIAARLEGAAEPGRILVSDAVHENVRGRVDRSFEDLGEQHMKNIARPVRVYRVGTGAGREVAATEIIADKPSIAVLPFTNLSGDIDQEYFADGVADDIITGLSRVRSFFVIARNSSFSYKGQAVDVRKVARELGVRYVLEGSVRRGADRLRVTAQLVDAETGNHLWADRYDRSLRDLFELQDEIAASVINAIRPTVADAELQRALRKAPESIGAWETYQRGLWHLLSHEVEGLPRARELFARAVEMDATMGAAHAALAWLCFVESAVFGLASFEDGTRKAVEHARAAIAADPNDADAHAVLALLLFAGGGDLKTASGHVEQALAITPSCATAYFAKGSHLLFRKQLLKGRENYRIAQQLDPRGLSNLVVVRLHIAISYYFEKNYETALELVRGVIAEDPTNPLTHRWLAACLGQLGRTEEAREALKTAMTRWPESFRRYTQTRAPWYLPDDFEHLLDGLRKAGWQGPAAPITGNS